MKVYKRTVLDAIVPMVYDVDLMDFVVQTKSAAGGGGQVEVVASVLPTGAATESALQSILTELGQKTEPSNVQLISSKVNLTPSSPTYVMVGTSPVQLVASNANRKGLDLGNIHTTGRISLGHTTTPVLDSGDTLFPYDAWTMTEHNFHTGAINAIGSEADIKITIQEFT